MKALKFLRTHQVAVEIKEIRLTPPTIAELKQALEFYDGKIKKLLNTSGQDYRALGLKDKLNDLSTDEIVTILSKNGNLVKRPFLVLDNSVVLCGFKEDIYLDRLGL